MPCRDETNSARMFSGEPRTSRLRLAIELMTCAVRPRHTLMLWHALRRSFFEYVGMHGDAEYHRQRFAELMADREEDRTDG